MKKKIDVINGLRGFAILAVIYEHLFSKVTDHGWFGINIAGYEVFPFSFLSNGWAGVNLFFILSGFVLYLPYAGGSRDMSSWGDALSFYKRRGRRLLPLYFISVLFMMFFLYGAAVTESVNTFLKNLFLMSTATFIFTKEMWLPKYNALLWSMGIEIWFSVLFPLVVVLARRVGVSRLFIAVSALGLAVRVAGVYYNGLFEIESFYQGVLKDSLPARLDDFVLGMMLCERYLNGRAASPKAPALAFLSGLVVLTAGFNAWDYWLLGMAPWTVIPFTNNVFHLGFYLIISSLLAMDKGAIRRLFSNRPMQVTGMMCYSLYVWHMQAKFAVISTKQDLFHILTYLAFVFAFSALTYRYIEFGGKETGELFLIRPRKSATSLQPSL